MLWFVLLPFGLETILITEVNFTTWTNLQLWACLFAVSALDFEGMVYHVREIVLIETLGYACTYHFVVRLVEKILQSRVKCRDVEATHLR